MIGFKAYDLIAVHAGLTLGLRLPPLGEAAKLSRRELNDLAALVADDSDAAKLRDELYLEFERRLRDPGYTGAKLMEWFEETYCPIGRSSMYRAMGSARANMTRIRESNEIARAYMEITREEGPSGVFDAATELAGEYMFHAFYELNVPLDPDTGQPKTKPDMVKVSKLINALAKLQKSRAETEQTEHKTAQMKAFDEQVNAAKGKKKSGKFTQADIDELRKAVFGEAA